MLYIVTAAGPATAGSVLRAMFEARKRVFVDLLKWQVPVLDGRFEIDQFDSEHATYLVLADRDGRHLGSARLLPTTRPHILDSLFAELCDGPVPRAPDTWEITRFCLDRRLRAAERRAVRDTLVLALVDHALADGIRRYSAIASIGWVNQILSFGWCSLPLGLPRVIGAQTLAALSIEIDATTPDRLRAAGISPQPALIDAPTRQAA
jgi:acyl-homoserine lactone synthase